MAIIRVKRGTTTPTTSNLTQVGEMGFNTNTNELFIRGNSSVVKIGGGIEELEYSYTGNVSSHNFSYSFNNAYIYRLVVLASTNYKGSDTSQTVITYKTSSGTILSGSYLTLFNNDVYSSQSKFSSRNTSNFLIADAHSGGVTPSYAITKTIDMDIMPSFESSTTSTYQWIIKGKSIASVSDQSNATITLAEFVHSVDGTIGQILIDPGLDLGSTDTIQVSLYRKRRK